MTRRELTPQGREALADARVSNDVLRDAKAQAALAAQERRKAVLRASRGGASYRVIARELGLSMPSVQHLVDAARATEDQP